MYQIIKGNVKSVTHRDKPAGNYQPTVQFPSDLMRILASFSSQFCVKRSQVYCSGSVSLISSVLSATGDTTLIKPIVACLHSTNKVSI